MTSIQPWFLLACGGLMVGCAAPIPPRPSMPPMPVDAPPVESDRARGPWMFAYTTGIHRYEVASKAIVEAVETGVRDSVWSVVHLRLAIDRDGEQLLIRGTVDSFSIRTGDSIPKPVHELRLPLAFAIRTDLQGRIQEFTSPDTSSCGSAAGTLLATARELLVPVPPRLSLGIAWEDSTSTTTCRGDIPISVTVARDHLVDSLLVAGPGPEVLRITRRTEMQISGTGSGPVQATTVTGSGTGETSFLLEPARGVLRSASGESISTLTVDAASRRQTFRQTVRTELRLLPLDRGDR